MKGTIRRFILINTGILAVVLVGGWALLGAIAGRIDGKVQEIAADRVRIASQLQSVDLLSSYRNIASQVSFYKQQMDMLLPTADQLLGFSSYLDGLSRASQVSASFSFQGSQVAPQGSVPGYIGFSLDTNGPLANLAVFFDNLETNNSRYLLHFDSLDTTAVGGGTYRVVAQGKLFFGQ